MTRPAPGSARAVQDDMNFGPLEFAAHLKRRETRGRVLSLSRKDAELPGVSLFEAVATPVHGAMACQPVKVVVGATSRPVVLVLSACQPVSWHLEVLPGTPLRAVLLAGDGAAQVCGAGDVAVVPIGNVYAFRRGSRSFQHLEREVRRITGARIDRFQSASAARTFRFRTD